MTHLITNLGSTIQAVEIEGIGRISRVNRHTSGHVIDTMYSKGWDMKTRMSGWTHDLKEADQFKYKKAQDMIEEVFIIEREKRNKNE